MPFRATYTADSPIPGAATPAAASAGLTVAVTRGPERSYTSTPLMGFIGTHALRFDGRPAGAAARTPDGEHPLNRALLHELDEPITDDSYLTYVYFPVLDDTPSGPTWAAGYAALDVVFADGGRLSDLGPLDQLGYPLTAAGQGGSKALYHDQWNYRETRIGTLAAGRRAVAIELVWQPVDVVDAVGSGESDDPAGRHGVNVTGYFDDICCDERPDHDAPRRPSDWVRTTRGTNATGRFSRGNNLPATAWPNGFNLYTPCTNARTTRWVYEYASANDEQNRPQLQALSVSHEPSPWMGDRLTFQVMPAAGGAPTADPHARAVPFTHEDEVARPHYYGVLLDNGITAEIAPADHAAVFRFGFPDGNGRLVFDNATAAASVTVAADGTVTGWSDVTAGPRADGAGRMFVYGQVSEPVTGHGSLDDGAGPGVAGYLQFDPSVQSVQLRLATSFIGLDQARRNLELEIGLGADAVGFDEVSVRALTAWDDRLRVLELDPDGGDVTPEALTTLYSNLYRLNLYPNSGHENVGTVEEPVWRHASPGAPAEGKHTAAHTGNSVRAGKLYVNNGFWDTYRTAWPLYSLLYPTLTGELVDGFVAHYRDAGWIPRWSSPGYADCMVGTSSDVAFADAMAKGVTDFDAGDAYAAALRNACVATDDTRVGRKSLDRSIFAGYTSVSEPEGMSWSIDGYINDLGIATMAGLLADRTAGPDRARLLDERAYFLDRAQGYVRLFDSRIGFFQGRQDDGSWRCTPATFDPAEWGHDYTETNAWNMAFTVPHDGAGLAGLYGGRDALAAKLAEFFGTQERADRKGSYNGVIHEMVEARDVRLGMYGHSNQPAHHIAFMWLHARRPDRTQEIVREVLRRCYAGSQIGQGYGGDEDNGEMSAWQLFGALGLYPLAVGTPTYVLGSPAYRRLVLHREDGTDLVVVTQGPVGPDGSPAVYVHGVSVDGVPHPSTSIEHAVLADAREVVFTTGAQPGEWGTDEAAVPPSLSDRVGVPDVYADVSAGTCPVAGLVDDSSAVGVELAAGTVVPCTLAAPARVQMYTLTSAPADAAPSSWRLEGSSDGTTWRVLDERTDQDFEWTRYTRPFSVRSPELLCFYRLVFAEAGALAQVELLARGQQVLPA